MSMTRLSVAFTTVLLLSGCGAGGGLGSLGDILGSMGGMGGGGAQQGTIEGEVQQVDTRGQRIHIRNQQGQSGALRFDQQTQVIYQQQQYPITALEAGDLVRIQAQQTSGNELYAARVDVVQSVQDRTGQSSTGQRQTYQGTVGQIDHQQGWFELRSSSGGAVTVALPYNVDRATTDRFHSLRRGDNVRLEGTALNAQRVELYRFY